MLNQNNKKISITISLVALNLIIGSLVSFLKLPIYLDSIGIVISTILLGWQYGLLCSMLTVGFGFFLINPYLLFYFGTSVMITFTVHWLRKFNYFANIYKVILSGLIIAFIAAICSAPVTAYLFGGSTLSGVDALTIYFKSVGHNILSSVFLSGLSSEPIDKIAVTIIAFQVLRAIPKSFIIKNNLNYFKDI